MDFNDATWIQNTVLPLVEADVADVIARSNTVYEVQTNVRLVATEVIIMTSLGGPASGGQDSVFSSPCVSKRAGRRPGWDYIIGAVSCLLVSDDSIAL